MEHCICYNYLKRLGYAVLRYKDLKHKSEQSQCNISASTTHTASTQPCRGWWPPCDTTNDFSTDIIIEYSTRKDKPLNYCNLPKIPKHQPESDGKSNNGIFIAFSIFYTHGFTKKNSGTPAFNIVVVR